MTKHPKKISLVAGARPNFMKIAPILRAAKQICFGAEIEVFHTGQHFDHNMSKVFFNDLEMPFPKHFLANASNNRIHPMRRIMEGYEQYCSAEKPDITLVVGDVDSTLACSLVSKKLGIQVGHIEAGLRSFDNEMPEEINRICTDAISDIFFASERAGLENLIREGYDERNIHFVGNVMIDNLLYFVDKLERNKELYSDDKFPKREFSEYCVVTLHRPSNVDDSNRLMRLMSALNQISNRLPVIFPVHPRTQASLKKLDFKASQNIHYTEPLPYLEFLNLWRDSEFVITDSGGLQEETTALGVPCLTLRENTERPVTVSEGTNTLLGTNINLLLSKVDEILTSKKTAADAQKPELWDGLASERILSKLSGVLNC